MPEMFWIIGIGNLARGLPLLAVLGLALIVVSTGHFASLGIASGRMAWIALRRRRSDLRGLRQAAEISRLKSELQASQGGTSVAWRVMQVAEVVAESADCRSYYLIDVYRQALPMFRPGQHVLVRPAMAGGQQSTRCYSLSSVPDARYWRITVKRQLRDEEPPARADGSRARSTQPGIDGRSAGLSSWLHDSIAAGDYLLVGGPSGHFFLSQDSSRGLVLLAAGVGITPLASMLLWSQRATPGRPMRLLYQAQDVNHWPLGQPLHRALEHFADGRVISYFSRATQADRALFTNRLPGELRLGKFHAGDALDAAQGLDCDYFLCGPDAWMRALREGLRKSGVEADRIHWESFGSAAPPAAEPRGELTQPLSVRFQRSGVEARWSDTQQTLWELARQHQVDIPSGCLSGACGGCRVKLLQGQVAHARPVAIDLADDECLACIARPKTACRIDA